MASRSSRKAFVFSFVLRSVHIWFRSYSVGRSFCRLNLLHPWFLVNVRADRGITTIHSVFSSFSRFQFLLPDISKQGRLLFHFLIFSNSSMKVFFFPLIFPVSQFNVCSLSQIRFCPISSIQKCWWRLIHAVRRKIALVKSVSLYGRNI